MVNNNRQDQNLCSKLHLVGFIVYFSGPESCVHQGVATGELTFNTLASCFGTFGSLWCSLSHSPAPPQWEDRDFLTPISQKAEPGMLCKAHSFRSKIYWGPHHRVETLKLWMGRQKWVGFNLMLRKINFRSGTKGQERPDSQFPNAYCWQCWHEISSAFWLWLKVSQAKNVVCSVNVQCQAQREQEPPWTTGIWMHLAFLHESIHTEHYQAFVLHCKIIWFYENVPNQLFSLNTQRSLNSG